LFFSIKRFLNSTEDYSSMMTMRQNRDLQLNI
jgi:hypothetical protein